MLDGVTVLECLLDFIHGKFSRSVSQLRYMRTYFIGLVRDIRRRDHDSWISLDLYLYKIDACRRV